MRSRGGPGISAPTDRWGDAATIAAIVAKTRKTLLKRRLLSIVVPVSQFAF
jgi:hypothetical protein